MLEALLFPYASLYSNHSALYEKAGWSSLATRSELHTIIFVYE